MARRAWVSANGLKLMSEYEETFLKSKPKKKDLLLSYEYMKKDVEGRGRMALFGCTEDMIGYYNAAEEKHRPAAPAKKRPLPKGASPRKKARSDEAPEVRLSMRDLKLVCDELVALDVSGSSAAGVKVNDEYAGV